MNTIRVFLLLFIVFSVFIVSYILDSQSPQDVLTHTDESFQHVLSGSLPPGSTVTSVSDTSATFTSPSSVSGITDWYREKHKQSNMMIAQDGQLHHITIPFDYSDEKRIIIKLHQNISRDIVTGTIMIDPS